MQPSSQSSGCPRGGARSRRHRSGRAKTDLVMVVRGDWGSVGEGWSGGVDGWLGATVVVVGRGGAAAGGGGGWVVVVLDEVG